MKREELKAYGLTEEQVEKVMADYGADVQGINAKIKDRDKEISELKAAGDPKEWEAKFNEVSEELNKTTAEFTTFRRDAAVREKLGDRYHNPALVMGQIQKEITMSEDGNLQNFEEVIRKFDAENPYMLKETKTTVPEFLSAGDEETKVLNPTAQANNALREALGYK